MADIKIAKQSDLEDFVTDISTLSDEISQKANSTHSHVWADITDAPTIPEMPDTSDLATKGELSTGLDGKADTSHVHSYESLTGKPTIPSIDGLASQADLDTLQGVVEALQAEVEALKGETEPEA